MRRTGIDSSLQSWESVPGERRDARLDRLSSAKGERTDQSDDLAALQAAARAAIEYRRSLAAAERTPAADYGEMLAAFEGPVPAHGAPALAIIEELARLATPGIRASAAPRFFGFVIGGSHAAGVAADWLTSAWGQNVGNVVAAP